MDLLLATRNPNKTREFRELLGQAFGVIDLSSFPEIATPEEAGRTSEENAILKAIAVFFQPVTLAKMLVTFRTSINCFASYESKTSRPKNDRRDSGALSRWRKTESC